MTYLTPPEARKTMPCPVARTFDKKVGPNCDADACPMWRWREIAANDNRVMSAYRRVQQDMLTAKKEKNPDSNSTLNTFHKQAVAKVAAAPWDFIFMDDEDRGFCGLAGKP